MSILDVLRPVTFGQRVAEEEGEQLSAYFVETDHWHRLLGDAVDVVYGPKGSGKSALYSLLVARAGPLFDKGILLAAAENPRGAPAFRALVTDPPASEREFVALWKLYLACLASSTLEEYGVLVAPAQELRERLEASGLRPRERTLSALLRAAFDYVKTILRPAAIEGTLSLDPATQLPSGITGKIVFGEPSAKEASDGAVSVDHLLALAEDALHESRLKLWFLLDRLDVAFSDSSDLETNALRALFHVYLDLIALEHFRLKIFLRSDIWRRITTTGFREASHITRHLTIEWNNSSLLNLIARRAAQNDSILAHFGITKAEALLSMETQKEFFGRIFPDQVEIGLRKPSTLDWLITRTADGTDQSAPRELIHLLNALRDVQVRRLEIGDPEPDGGRLFGRSAFKEALPEVSRTRLHQTLFAEYPQAREIIERLQGEKTQHSIDSLAAIWKMPTERALESARMLTEIGFFQERGEKENPIFWVPFLYRDALDLVQGAAD